MEALARLGEMAEGARSLHAVFPDLSFPLAATRILIISTQRRVSEGLVHAIELAARRPLVTLNVDVDFSDSGFPDLQHRQHVADAIWFVYRHDRFEYKSRAFIEWADTNRVVLANVPLHGFSVFTLDGIRSISEPVLVERVTIGGREVPVSPVLLDTKAGEFTGGARFDAPHAALADALLFSAVRRATNNRPYGNIAEAWDEKCVTALTGMWNSHRTGAGDALTHFGRLHRMHHSSRTAALAIGQVLVAASALDVRRARPDRTEEISRELALSLGDLQHAAPVNDDDYVPPPPFANEFQALQRRAIQRADALIRSLQDADDAEDVRIFETAREDLHEEVKIILLGAFSSGKSTLINAMLGLTDEHQMLPMRGRPETATINVLVHGDDDRMSVKFKPITHLQLFSESPYDEQRWAIHTQELQAFLRWLYGGLIDTARAPKYHRVSARSVRKQKKELRPLSDEDVAFLNQVHESNAGYIKLEYLLDRERIWLVDDIRFHEHPDFPDPTDSKAGFEWLNMPENALRVAEVTIQRNVDALTGLRFVDTPGTDSFIPHHQTLATGYIEQYASSPIIYLFDAGGAGSETDAANIAFLKTLKEDNARLFFVINKRSILNNEKEEREVIAQVQLRLRDAGLKAKRLYLVDARSALTDRSDEEWIALEDDLRTFIAGNRTELLRGLIRSRFCNALESRLGDFRKQVETLQSGVEERAARAAQWHETARAIKKVLRQFADAAAKLKEELFDSASGDFTGDVSDIDDDLASFDCGAVLPGTKSRKMQELVDIVDRLDRWPKRLKDNLASASRHLHAFLRNELASQAVGAEARVDPAQMSPDFVPITLTDIRAKAREDIVRGGGKWNFFASFRPAMESKVARLREMVQSEKTAAVRRVRTEFEKIVTSYSDQVAPYATRAKGFAKQAEGSGDTTASIQTLKASIRLLEKHFREFNGILQ